LRHISARSPDSKRQHSVQLAAAVDGDRIVRLVAHYVGAEVHPASPPVSAELPGTGVRFEGLIPPVVAAPAFAIRTHAVAILAVRDYASTGIMNERAG
jgi:Flp pilus assembly CpaF family ATPase